MEHFHATFGVYVAFAITIWPRKSPAFGARPDMSVFLRRISQWLCSHQFSWPHCGVAGQDYQVCLRCGVVYEYDVHTMRRTKRLDLDTDAVSRLQ